MNDTRMGQRDGRVEMEGRGRDGGKGEMARRGRRDGGKGVEMREGG